MAILNQILPTSLYNNDPLIDTLTLPAEPALGTWSSSTVYRARMNGKPSALVLDVVAPDGYSGDIKMLAAFSATGNLIGLRVVEHRETPGLGDYIDPAKTRTRNAPGSPSLTRYPRTWMLKAGICVRMAANSTVWPGPPFHLAPSSKRPTRPDSLWRHIMPSCSHAT